MPLGLIWITGARGFLGRHVAARFAAEGWRVAAIGLGGSRDAAISDVALERVAGRSAWIEAAIAEAPLEALLALTGPPDAVLHAAGSGEVGASFANPLADFRMAVETTAIVLDFLRRRAPGAHFMLPSSAAIYGDRPMGPIAEDTAPDPRSPYGAHKLAAEWLCRSAARDFGRRVTIVRFFSLYGPGLRKQLLWDVARRLAPRPDEIVLAGTGEETRDLLHVEDAADLAWRAVAAERPSLIVNGGTGIATSVRRIAQGLADALGLDTRIRFNGSVRPGDPRHFQADQTRALAELGFRPKCRLEDGLAAYARWWEAEHAMAATP